MSGQHVARLSVGLSLVWGLIGCDLSAPPGTVEQPQTETILRPAVAAYKQKNAGRVVGTLSVNDDIRQWAGVTNLEGAEVQAFDPDGAALTDKVAIDANGNFVLENLRESRPRIFIEASLKDLRFRATIPAPRRRVDVPVTLDPASTYLADKLRRAALDHDVPLANLAEDKVDQVVEVVNLYMEDTERRTVLEQNDPDLNAYAFDHFMDDHESVKRAVYTLSPAILRGWKPTPIPVVTPTPKPRTSPSVSPSPLPSATPTGPEPV